MAKNSLIPEDWERAWLHDTLFLREEEFQEMESLAQMKPPAKITLIPSLEEIRKTPKLLKNT